MNKGEFDDEFEPILYDLLVLFNKHEKIKKDSWKNCDIDYLMNKLIEEFKEFSKDYNYKELLDLILISLFIAKRLKGEV